MTRPMSLPASSSHTFVSKAGSSFEPQFRCLLRVSPTSPSPQLLQALSLGTAHSLLRENGLCLHLTTCWNLNSMTTGVCPAPPQPAECHTHIRCVRRAC